MNKFKSTEKLLIDGKNATAVGSTSSEAKTRNVDLLNAREVDSAIKGIRIESIGEQSGQVMYGSYGRVRDLLESGDEFFISIIMSQLSSVLGSPTMNIFNEKGIDWIKPDFAKYVQVNSSGEILFHEKDFNSWLELRQRRIEQIESKTIANRENKESMSVGSTLVMLGREYVCLGQFALINARISKDKSSFSVNKKAALEWVFFRNGDGKFLFTNKFDKNCKVIPPTKETIALAKEVLELADDKERFATMWTSKVAKRPWSSSSRNTCDLNLIPDRLLELTKFSTRKSSTKEFTDEVRHAIYDFVETFYDEVIHVKQVSLSEKSQPFTEIYNAKSISKRTLDSNFRDPGMADKFRNMISA